MLVISADWTGNFSIASGNLFKLNLEQRFTFLGKKRRTKDNIVPPLSPSSE